MGERDDRDTGTGPKVRTTSDRDGGVDHEQVLLTATVDELRERAERLHDATQELAAQNERLRAAQDALEDEHARYRELFDLAPDAFLLTDESGRVIEANGRASALLGVDGDALVGTPLLTFVEAVSHDAFREHLAALAESGGRQVAEVRVEPPSGGDALDVEATVVAIPGRGDGVVLLWLLRDVTEQVGITRSLGRRLDERTVELARTRQRAERERLHLRDLLHRLQEGVVAVDAEGCVVYANDAAKLFFLPADLIEGRAMPRPWPNLDLHAFVAALFTSRPVREVHVTTANGRLLALRGIPALEAETAGLLISDVSTRERRERAEREFVANAAHEIRTPLTAITGAIEVLQAGAKDDPDQRELFLAHIERESARLGRLSTALLLLARAQMGVEAPRVEVVPLLPVLEAVAGETHPATGVTIEVSCVPGLAALANRTLLEQALGNLASNAAKHTLDGSISLRAFALDADWVSLEVADTGPGLAPDAQPRATERFYRAGGAEGFGLGLAIATESARAVGGRLELDSERGRGTTARIVLPGAEVVASE